MPITYVRNHFVKYICQAALVHFVFSLRTFKIFFKVKFIHLFVILLPVWLRGLMGPTVQQVCLTLVSSNAFVKVQSRTWFIHLNTPEIKFLVGECRTILQTKAAQTRQQVDNKSFKRQSERTDTMSVVGTCRQPLTKNAS